MKHYIVDVMLVAFTIFIIILAAVGIAYLVSPKNPPVEESKIQHMVDSVTAKNDSVKAIIIKLDSIKNEKIIEVKSLDNDSTLKLFYELIRE